ncbi:hypothetical protein B0T20DRAFT_355074 [Sordaria brevicollis]|uniref:Extracellular serine-rich protein n=1 Tax=Sordaria brevicollis TaxID=83679 RepID=A0AAE0PDN4_SORBR|nr:hypothetical protein B0T20DRAFT_355074 [Sordaria brevicollis]
MYGSRLLAGAATAALTMTAAAQTFITAPIPSLASTATSTASLQQSTSSPRIHNVTVGFKDDMWSSGEDYANVTDMGKPVEWLFTVRNDAPMFFYCSARRSCSEHQMIGVINPNATHTWEIQLDYAKRASYDLKPGETIPAEDPEFGKPTSTPSSPPTPSTKPEEDGGKKSGLGAGAIAGIAIGAAAVVVIGAALLYLCGRRGGFDKAYRKSVLQLQTPAADSAGAPTMVEAQYNNGNNANPVSPVPAAAGLKSPAQASFATFSTHPHMDPNDPYRSMTASPQQPPYPYGTPPPQQNPASPGSVYGFNSYNGQPVSTPGSPPMGPHSPLMIGELSSVPHSRSAEPAPVELPSGDGPTVRPPSMLPGSPPPQYESGNAGEEHQYGKR